MNVRIRDGKKDFLGSQWMAGVRHPHRLRSVWSNVVHIGFDHDASLRESTLALFLGYRGLHPWQELCTIAWTKLACSRSSGIESQLHLGRGRDRATHRLSLKPRLVELMTLVVSSEEAPSSQDLLRRPVVSTIQNSVR